MGAEISELKHGTLVQVANLGVLILGKSGSGKSALALSMIDQPGRGIGKEVLAAMLVADDQVCLSQDEVSGKIIGKPPGSLAGLMEIRGIGIVSLAYVPSCYVDLIVQISAPDEIERMPDFPNDSTQILGKAIPVIKVSAHDTTASAKIRVGIGILLCSNTVENNTAIR